MKKIKLLIQQTDKYLMTMINRLKKYLDSAHTIAITTHLHPDADGIGSQVALCMALRRMGKDVICVNECDLMPRYRYLDPQGYVISHETYQKNTDGSKIDLMIVVDTNSQKRIGKNLEALSNAASDILFIDHHPCDNSVMDNHCIDTTKAATGELVGYMIEELGIEFDQEMALPLYTSILIDTSSFRYPTVTGDTHRLVAKLMDTGVKPPYAYNKINGTKRLVHMQLLGKILSNCKMCDEGKIAWLTISKDMIDDYGVVAEDTHSYVNHLLILDNIEVACMFRDDDGMIKVSFRSGGNIDVGEIASKLGGGGHNHSAATVKKGNLDEVIEDTLSAIRKFL